MATAAMPASGGARVSANRLKRFWDSSVGKKVVMAVTGIIGIGFVFGHMAGNLQMFKGTGAAQAMHDYAVLLRKTGGLLWLIRGVLLGAVALHVTAALQLTARNRAARPVAYGDRKSQVSTLGARTMRAGGIILLAFIVFHIADMTLGLGVPDFRHLDPYHNLRNGFSRPWALAFYVVAMACLGLHLYHGAWASLRTLGARRPSANPLHRNIAIVLAIVVALGFAAVPIGAALGLFTDETPVLDESQTVHGGRSAAPVAAAPLASIPTGGAR
ncbi:MAG TPA: succinate dehydrogenase cytochrome b subunit [Gemmatimonadaceae bacterium]|nr:succinate dehydrogenase cytochrome b subunit [Gemmatimonadaceae bacterium]